MLSNALALSLLTTSGCILIYRKLPPKIRKLIEEHSLLTDLATLLAVYTFLGGTVTALVASAMCGIMISAMLHIVNNPDDYLYLYDLKNFIQEKLARAKQSLNEYGKEYREKKLESQMIDIEHPVST